MDSTPSDLISTRTGLDELFGRHDGEQVCAVDTEADSLHRFRESLCLIQFAAGDESVLIDPLALEDLAPVGHYLSSRTVWMHGADYDMTMLRREFGTIPPVVYDTQIGARLLGLRKFGLANLVEHFFDVKLSKSSQKADWGKRPLSSKMVDYALNDVRYLLPMAGMIVNQLREKGRYDWFVESCEVARTKVAERDDSKGEPWRIQGSGRLDRKGLHFLRALWLWRNAEAEAWDRPSFMVATNRQLLDWSSELVAGKRVSFPGHYRSDRRRRCVEAIEQARQAPESAFPERIRGKRRRRDKDFDRRVAEMIGVRDRRAGELDIDPSLIASRAVIEGLAAGEDEAREQVMNWQAECLGIG